MTKQKNCCIIGHRNFVLDERLKEMIKDVLVGLIVKKGVKNFLFGSRSRFNDSCLEIVTELKSTYPDIKRIYIRAEYPDVSKKYHDYLLKSYDSTFFPERIKGSGRASYVERNKEMIDSSDYAVFYYDRNYLPQKSKKSGTEHAYIYASKRIKKENVINIFTKEKD